MKNISKLATFLMVGFAVLLSSLPVNASSHREAPFIAELPKVDGTDFYIFNSYESGKSDFVTIIANYQPLQQAYGGPNFFSLDPDALYDINIDNNGDAVEDIVFRFRVMNTLNDIALDIDGEMVSVPFINVGQIGPNITDNMSTNVVESYSLEVLRKQGSQGKGNAKGKAMGVAQSGGTIVTNADTNERTFIKPTDNIGDKSIPNYEAYAKKHIYNIKIPGCNSNGKVFVGQRREGFAVDLGGTFDLVNFNPLGDTMGGFSEIADNNITSFALEIPKSCLTNGSEPIIGAWTTSSLPKARVFGKSPTFDKPTSERGPFVQVSRLSAPLVNELVIGLKDKNKFNSSHPSDDAQFATYVTNPTLPAVLELLFSSAGYKAPTAIPRTDLVAAFLTGVEGLNKPANVKASEMMRLNTSISAVPASQQNELGVIGGDNAGFPNGRRPGDDVVDIELRAASGVLLPQEQAPAGQLPITDGAFINANDFDQSFPYLKSPVPGKVAQAQ